MVLSVSSGYSPEYLLKQVATGRENYYTGAVAEGEPPGRWWGAGAERLGLRGLVEAQDMRAVYERFLDPRAEGFNDPARWGSCPRWGTPVGRTSRRTSCTPPRLNASRTPALNAGLNSVPKRARRPGGTWRSMT
ncbi:relaxase domain-containing protein [Pseudonocardia benzenivorans]